VQIEMPVERYMRFGAHPAGHGITADEHNEGTATVDCGLQAFKPLIDVTNALVVAKQPQAALAKLFAEIERLLPIAAVLAEKDVVGFRYVPP